MKNKRKKRAITLLEIMIVIFLIGLIGSVIGVNMKGSMDKGKAFKTEHAIQQLKDIFELQLGEGETTIADIVGNPAHFLKRSGMVKDPDKMLKDGWNERFEISTIREGTEIKILSKKWERYKAKQKDKTNNASQNTPQAPNQS